MPSPDQPDRLPWVRLALGLLLLAAALVWRGPKYPEAAHPADGRFGDYLMYWLSAKNYFAGFTVYDDQPTAFARYHPGRPFDARKFFLAPYNTHPPAAVLFALPFAALSYPDAHLWWNLSTAAVLLCGLVLAVREVGGRWWWCHLPLAAAVLVWAAPTLASAAYGQPNFLLAGLLALGWVADRRGYGVAAGVCVGLATAVKLFPGLVFVHFLLTGRWRALVAGVVTVVGLNALAAGLFGVDAFRTHQQVAVPSLIEYQAAAANLSVNGYFQRLFDPHPAQCEYQPWPLRNPTLAKAAVGVVDLLLLAAVVVAVRVGRRAGPDGGWAACVPAMLLLSPITWGHYFVLLVLPFVVLFARFRGPVRWGLAVTAVGFGIADHFYWALGVSREHREAGVRLAGPYSLFPPLSPAECVGLLATPTYLLLILLVAAVAAALRDGRGARSPAAGVPPARPPESGQVAERRVGQ